MTLSLRFGVAHDFRCPPGSPYSLRDVYAQTMEQISELDRLGLDLVWFSEHHFLEDGYLPSFVPVAGAAAALTTRMRISTNISIVPFNHPLRLAEDLAVLDQLSNGRMEFGIGLGYVPKEFEGFRIPIQQRVSRTEECIEILRLAWSGQPFSYHGKRWDFDDIRVTPDPIQPGGPPLWLAVSSEPGVARAVRYGTHVLPQGPRRLLDNWRASMRAAGADPTAQRVGIIRTCLVTDDPRAGQPSINDAETLPHAGSTATTLPRWASTRCSAPARTPGDPVAHATDRPPSQATARRRSRPGARSAVRAETSYQAIRLTKPSPT